MKINPFLTCVNIKPSPLVKRSPLTLSIPSHTRPTLCTEARRGARTRAVPSAPQRQPRRGLPRARTLRGGPGLSRLPRHPQRGTAGTPPRHSAASPPPFPLSSVPSQPRRPADSTYRPPPPRKCGRAAAPRPAGAGQRRAAGERRAAPTWRGRSAGGCGSEELRDGPAAAHPGRDPRTEPRCFGVHQ